jgi:hypothetical protein
MELDKIQKQIATEIKLRGFSKQTVKMYVFYNTQDYTYRFDNVYLLSYMLQRGGYIGGNNYYYGFENGIKEIGTFDVHFYIASGFYDASGSYSKDVDENVYFNIKNTSACLSLTSYLEVRSPKPRHQQLSQKMNRQMLKS